MVFWKAWIYCHLKVDMRNCVLLLWSSIRSWRQETKFKPVLFCLKIGFMIFFCQEGWLVFFDLLTLVAYLITNHIYILYIYIRFENEYFVGNILNKPQLICLPTVKWFHAFSYCIDSFIWTQLNSFKYFCLTQIIICRITHLFAHS